MELSLSDWQEEIIFNPARFRLLAGGRKLGKSFVAADEIIVQSLHRRRGSKTLIATPTKSQEDEILEAFWKVDGIDEHMQKTLTRPTRFFFKNGSKAEFRSLERARNIRSKGAHLVILDEIQDIAQDAYESVIRPVVGATQGRILMLGQMRPGSWYHKGYFLPGQAGAGSELNPIDLGRPRYKSWLIPSRMGPAFMTEAGKIELETARQQTAKWRWELEWEGTLKGDAPDTCFPGTQIDRIIRGTPTAAPTAGRQYFKNDPCFLIGLDIGKQRDPSAAVVLNVDTRQVEHTERFPLGMEHEAQARRAAALAREWGGAGVIIDGTGGGAPGRGKGDQYIRLYREACPTAHVMYQVWQNKTAMIEALALIIERQEINIPAALTELLEELRMYKCEYRKGFWRYFGTPDDLVSALAMATFARQHQIGIPARGDLYRGAI